MSKQRASQSAAALLAAVCATAVWASDDRDHDRDDGARAAMVAARSKFFGAENVNVETGALDRDQVIFSWVTNATIAVSMKGHVMLLDTYVNRLELTPASGPDLRRTPISYQDLVNLHPEALFLGHGHGDHADNAAYIAKWLNIPIYASPETCDVMQVDVMRMNNDPNTVNGGARIVPDGNPVNCIPLVSRGSVPGTEVVHLDQFEPLACIIAFKHIHSGSVPTDPDFPLVPVKNITDPRDADLYPNQICLAPTSNSSCLLIGTPLPALPGQLNLTTTGFGNIPGSPGGSISFIYQFVLRGHNNFSWIWHNTTGPLKEGKGSDPGLPSPAVGAHLFSIMDSLPQTDIEFGAILSVGYPTNGTRDAVLYQQHIKPKIYVPLHMTDVAALASSLEFKKTYLLTLAAENAAYRPEPRWMVDPDDYLRPMVYDPGDARWSAPRGNAAKVEQFCGGR
jgi:L-ascorbate metabolism protein UlaG (beta-lactamase superfamily)